MNRAEFRAVFLLCLFSVAAFGCGSDSSGGKHPIVGVWVDRSATESVVFREDGTFNMGLSPQQSIRGRWEAEGQTRLTLSIEDVRRELKTERLDSLRAALIGEATHWDYSIRGDTLLTMVSFTGSATEYHRQ